MFSSLCVVGLEYSIKSLDNCDTNMYSQNISNNKVFTQLPRINTGESVPHQPSKSFRAHGKSQSYPFKPSRVHSKFPNHPPKLVGAGGKFIPKKQFKKHWKSSNNWDYRKSSFRSKWSKKFVPPWLKARWKTPPIDKRFNICLWIRQTYNNIFLTVTDSRGCVRTMISGGSSKLRGNNRTSYRSVEIITRILLRRIKRIKIRRVEFKTLCIFLVSPKNGLISFLLELLAEAPKVHMVSSRIRTPHNGMRLKKLRRL
jgi:ribosomal protein S11